jgi:hypothetical protein
MWSDFVLKWWSECTYVKWFCFEVVEWVYICEVILFWSCGVSVHMWSDFVLKWWSECTYVKWFCFEVVEWVTIKFLGTEASRTLGWLLSYFFNILLDLFCITVSMVVCFLCFCLILYNICSYCYDMYVYYYVMCYFVSLSNLTVPYVPFCVFCLIVLFCVLICVNVHCTTTTGCQHIYI